MSVDNFARFFEELDEDDATRIIMSGLEMMRAVTEVYGAERGQKLWEEMSNLLGKEAKHAIFAAMLTGAVPNRITVTHQNYGSMNGTNKVMAIKAIRAATGEGLKEAKYRVEAWYAPTGHSRVPVERGDRQELIAALRDAGFEAA